MVTKTINPFAMHKIKINTWLFVTLVVILFQACEAEPVLYNGPDLVHFSDLSSQMVIKERGENVSTITVGSTTVSTEDRTYSIQIIEDETTASEGLDYQLSNKTITIPAGEVITTFDVVGLYAGASSEGTTLKLTIGNPSSGSLAGFNNQYTIELFKFCSFDRDAFIGSYHCYEHSYWGEFEYDVHTSEASASSVNANGFWEVYGSEVEIIFDTYEGTCNIAEQYLFTNEEYGVVYIRGFEDGSINSCNGSIEGLSYYIFDSETNTLWDICTVDMYLKVEPAASSMSNTKGFNKPYKSINIEMK